MPPSVATSRATSTTRAGRTRIVDIFGREIWILASRRIHAGEELTYDYNTDGVAEFRASPQAAPLS